MFVMNCFDEDEAIGRHCIIIARWSSSWHHCRCHFALLLSSSSPCCQPLLLDFGHRHCLFVLLLSSLYHRHKMVVIMALMSLSLCVTVVVAVPLLSTIVFVRLLDVGCHHCLFVLLLSLSHHRHKMVVVMALLSLSLCVVVFVIVPLFVNHCFCWIVGFWPLSSSLCVAVITPLFLLLLLLLSVLGHHHCHSGLAHFQLIFLYSYFAFYFMF